MQRLVDARNVGRGAARVVAEVAARKVLLRDAKLLADSAGVFDLVLLVGTEGDRPCFQSSVVLSLFADLDHPRQRGLVRGLHVDRPEVAFSGLLNLNVILVIYDLGQLVVVHERAKHFCDPLVEERPLQNGPRRWPHHVDLVEHLLDQIFGVRGTAGRLYCWVATLQNLEHHVLRRVGLQGDAERIAESDHLKEDAAEGPDVGLLVQRLALEVLGRGLDVVAGLGTCL